MTIDEAIKHAEEVAEEQVKRCEKCAEEHRQLAEWLKELKQLREQTSCEDAVSRKAVSKFLENCTKDYEDPKIRMTFQAASSLVKNTEYIPPVTPKAKWIPVNERLPEDRENVLFSIKAGIVFEGRFFNDKTNLQWYEYRYKQFEPNSDVTAWQSLPKPYKAEMESEE